MLRRVENSGLLYNHNPICGERKWSKRQKLRLRLPITVSLRLFNYAGGGSVRPMLVRPLSTYVPE